MFHRTYKRAALLLALALVGTGITVAACSGFGPAYQCDTKPQAPIVSTELPQPAVMAAAIATCDTPPSTHQMHVSLERLNPAGWYPVLDGDGNGYGTCFEVPKPGSSVLCRRYVTPCVSAQYRTVVTVTGTGADGRSFSFNPPEKPEATIKCPQPKS